MADMMSAGYKVRIFVDERQEDGTEKRRQLNSYEELRALAPKLNAQAMAAIGAVPVTKETV